MKLVMKMVDWSDKVAVDFRGRIIVDPDSPILAFKANRDRYARRSQSGYAGLPHLGSQNSEDALTWNVFRSLQESGRLDFVCSKLGIGEPRGMLLWTLAPEKTYENAELQYAVGTLIRKFDGILPGQMTEPDVIILGTTGVAVIECKLSEPDRPPSHLWEGSPDSVRKRLPIYRQAEPTLIEKNVTDAQIMEIYQLVRMAFYALQFGKSLACAAVIVSLVNEKNWSRKMPRLGKSAAELWDFFQDVQTSNLRKQNISWQQIRGLITDLSLDELSHYLSSHPCL